MDITSVAWLTAQVVMVLCMLWACLRLFGAVFGPFLTRSVIPPSVTVEKGSVAYGAIMGTKKVVNAGQAVTKAVSKRVKRALKEHSKPRPGSQPVIIKFWD